MKIITKTTRHEMLRRWALAELDSEFFNVSDQRIKSEMHSVLISDHIEAQAEAITHVLAEKIALIRSLPQDLDWYIAMMQVTASEMDKVYTLAVPGWDRNTGGTYLISRAARNIKENPSLDPRIVAISNAFHTNSVQIKGITLLAEHISGPYLAVEGNGRLTAIYMEKLLKKSKIITTELEVIIGLSQIGPKE